MGANRQSRSTLRDNNRALAFSRDTADLLINGTTTPITAADINHDGRVTAADALEILKTSVGINTIQPSWVFVPNDTTINPNLASMTRAAVSFKDEFNLSSVISGTSASITGILVGDVNNSWVIPV